MLFEQSDWIDPEINLIREIVEPGMQIIDVGAGFGVYALPAAKMVGEEGKVFAFENDLLTRNFLDFSKNKNGFEHLEIIRNVVSDQQKEVSWETNPIPELSKISYSGDENVTTISLDQWWANNEEPSIEFIKIDTNGSEDQVLAGARHLVQSTRPMLLVSANPDNWESISSNMNNLEYTFYKYLPGSGSLAKLEADSIELDKNLIALSNEHVLKFKSSGLILDDKHTYDTPALNTWEHTFEQLPWATSMMFNWEYMQDTPEHQSYFEALNYLISAENLQDSETNERDNRNKISNYLIEAVHRLIEIYNSGNASISVVFTLTRALLALGKRIEAAHIMQTCIEDSAFGQKNMDAPLPFLMPIKKHELLPVRTDYAKWLMVRTIESWLLVKNESTFWANAQDQKIIEILDGNPEISKQMENIHQIRAFSEADKEKEESKRLVFITSDYPPYDEGRIGHSIRAYTLTNFFAEQGYDVYLIILAKMVADREAPKMHPKIQILNPLFYEQRSTDPELSVEEFTTQFMKKYGVKTLVTSSPPLTSHLIALQVKENLGSSISWISDFRDFIHIHPLTRSKTPEGYLEQKEIELQVMQNADEVITISTGMKKIADDLHQEFQANFTDSKFHLIENGFIEQEKVAVDPEVASFAQQAREEGRIVMYYAGTGSLIGIQDFEGVYKDLTFIFDVFSKNPEIAKKYALIIQGKVQVNLDYLKKLKTKLSFKFFDPVPNAQIQANLEVADIGLSVNSDVVATPYIMGGKLYDYANAGLALLLIYPDNPLSLMEFSKKHGDKCYFAHVFDAVSVRETLSQIIMEKDELNKRSFAKEEVKPYSRKEQYKKFLPLLEKGSWSKSGLFIHFCYNSVYAQTIADLLKYANENSHQRHVLYVEQEQTIQHFSVDLRDYPDAHLFDQNLDGQRLAEILLKPEVDAIFMHGLFRPWQFNIVDKIGDHKHIGWMIWGGDLYNPIKNKTTHLFPGKKLSSTHTPVPGDVKLFRENYKVIPNYEFGYLYPGLYGELPEFKNEHQTKRIIVGNSGDPSNYHIEILEKLAEKEDAHEYTFVLPIAYNLNQGYRKQLLQSIEELGLRNQVEFHKDFIAPDEYLAFIANSDMMLTAHDRQQAVGNLLMALYLNKPAFLRQNISKDGIVNENLGWNYLTSCGLQPNAFESLDEYRKIADIQDISNQVANSNREAIQQNFGLAARSELLINSCLEILIEQEKTKLEPANV